MKPKEMANDWAVIFDHTIQMGKLKILIVLGIQLSRLPFTISFENVTGSSVTVSAADATNGIAFFIYTASYPQS